MIERVIGVTELQRHFRRVLDEVVHEGTPYVLTRGSRPEAVIIPYQEFLAYQREREERIEQAKKGILDLLALTAERNAHFSEEEIAADIEAAREELYQERLRARSPERAT